MLQDFYTFQAHTTRKGKEFTFASKKELDKKIETYLRKKGANLHDFIQINDGYFYNPIENIFINVIHFFYTPDGYLHFSGYNIFWN